LGCQIRPEAEHEFVDDLARRGGWVTCIGDGGLDLVLRIGGLRGRGIPARRGEVGGQPVVHAVANGDFKAVQ
jgi:hypothetical protein